MLQELGLQFQRMVACYPASDYLRKTPREGWWGTKYEAEVRKSVDFAMTSLGLDLPWHEIHKDPMKESLAEVLFQSALSCFGPRMMPETYLALNQKFLGDQFRHHPSILDTTANHEAVPGRLVALDKDKKEIAGGLRASINMPTFPPRHDGRPTIGDISPIRLYQEGDKFLLELETPSGHKWIKEFQVLESSQTSRQIVGGKAKQPIYVYDVATPCASPYRVLFLTETCALDCDQCGFARGSGLMTPDRQEVVSRILDLMIAEQSEKSDTFYFTISSGSADMPDAGYAQAHGWALKQLEEKLKKVKAEQGKDMKVELELEMTLPAEKREWDNILKDIQHYVDLGWKFSLAMNIETLSPIWRKDFIHKLKGKTTLADYKEFNRRLKEQFDGKIHMSTLVMFGMKPIEVSYTEYMRQEINIIWQLLAEGIGVDLIPVRLQLGRNIEAFPPPDPVYYMIEDFVLRLMRKIAELPESPGCVYSCGLCHHKQASLAVINRALSAHKSLPDILEPIIKPLIGDKYLEELKKIYVIAQQKWDSMRQKEICDGNRGQIGDGS